MLEREQLVVNTFIDLADTLTSDFQMGEFLQMLVERCAGVLDVSTGGVVIESRDGALRLAAATSDDMEALEDAEINHQEGPCLDAYRNVRQVSADDLSAAELGRWPNIAPLAVEMGLVAVHAFPLRWRGDCIGALNLYRKAPGAFEGDDVRLAQAFADVAAIGILQERRVGEAERRSDQLQHALDSRVVIEQAKGLLAGRLSITPEEAFQRLRAHARARNEKIGVICRGVIEDDFVPD